jgi:Universal stress protein family
MRESTTTQLPVVVGIDGSQAAIRAAEWAIDEAVSQEVPLRLVAVIPRQAEPAPLESVGNIRMEVEYAQAALRITAAALAADEKLVKVETAFSRVILRRCFSPNPGMPQWCASVRRGSGALRGHFSVPQPRKSPKPPTARSPSSAPSSIGRGPTVL